MSLTLPPLSISVRRSVSSRRRLRRRASSSTIVASTSSASIERFCTVPAVPMRSSVLSSRSAGTSMSSFASWIASVLRGFVSASETMSPPAPRTVACTDFSEASTSRTSRSTCAFRARRCFATVASVRRESAGAAAAALPPGVFSALDAVTRIGGAALRTIVVLAICRAPSSPARVTSASCAWYAAAAAYHAHEAEVTRAGDDGARQIASTTIVRNAAPPMRVTASKALNTPGGSAAAAAPADSLRTEATVAKHRLARKAHVDLLVRDVEASLKSVQATVRGAGGDIVSLADTNPRSTEAIHEAKLDIEVPADRLESTLDRIGTAGTVQNRSIEAEDVDATIVDVLGFDRAVLHRAGRADAVERALEPVGGDFDVEL